MALRNKYNFLYNNSTFQLRSFYSVRKSLKVQAIVLDFDAIALLGGNENANSSRESNKDEKEKNLLNQNSENSPDMSSPSVQGLLSLVKMKDKLDIQRTTKDLTAQIQNILGDKDPSLEKETLVKDDSKATGKNRPENAPKEKLKQNGVTDIAAKYRKKLRAKTGGWLYVDKEKKGDAANLLLAKTRIKTEGTANQWMLKQGAGDLLKYLSIRSMLTVLLPTPRTDKDTVNKLLKQVESTGDKFALVVSRQEAESQTRMLEQILEKIEVDANQALLVSTSNSDIKVARDLKYWTCKFQTAGAKDNYTSAAEYVVKSVEEIKGTIEEVNGISYRQY